MTSQKTSENSKTISKIVWECFDVLKRDRNKFSEEQQ